MLQWVGGSRRKVITSRKSTQKRQKQYFEQRKRQLQQTAVLDKFTDGRGSCTYRSENNRSLDILSLENVSAVTQKQRLGIFTDVDDLTLNNQYMHPPHAILTNEGNPMDQSEINEERTSLNCGTEADSDMVSVRLPDNSEDLIDKKYEPCKLVTTHPISVIDLLGDVGANSNDEENSVHAQEAHVAFSVEGLGKVETETPVHSPKIPGRSFQNVFSPSKKARRQPSKSKRLDYGFYDLDCQVGINLSPCESLIELPFCPRDMINIFGDTNQKFLQPRYSSPFSCNGNNMVGDFGTDKVAYNISDSCRDIWNGPNFLDDNMDELGECESFCKNDVDNRNVGYDDCFFSKDPWEHGLFEDWNLQKKRSSTIRTEIFDMPDSPAPYPKHQFTEDLPEVIITDSRCYSGIGKDDDVKDDVHRHHFVKDDTTESSSLLSEESCSYPAVRGDTTKKL